MNMKVEMFRAVRELLGRGYVPDYYEQAAQPFIDIAATYAEKAEASLKWIQAEKHGAQADAEREKNVADGLRLRLVKAEAELARLTTLRPASEHDGETLVIVWVGFWGRWDVDRFGRLVGKDERWTPLPEPKEGPK